MNILGISGSLRAQSFNAKLLTMTASVLPVGVELDVFSLEAVPLYNEDLDTGDLPVRVKAFKDAIAGADALLIATPEYNFGMPGVLKNAIDWASRPVFKSPLVNKPTAIVSASLAMTGGARAQSQLKQVLAGTLTPVYPAPEYLVGAAHSAFDEKGSLNNEDAVERLRRFVDGFVAWSRDLVKLSGER